MTHFCVARVKNWNVSPRAVFNASSWRGWHAALPTFTFYTALHVLTSPKSKTAVPGPRGSKRRA